MKPTAVAAFPLLQSAPVGAATPDVRVGVVALPDRDPIVFVFAVPSSGFDSASSTGAQWARTPRAVAACVLGANSPTMAEHRKGKRKSTEDKHTKPRSGRANTKNRQKSGWKDNPNRRK